MTQSRYRQRFMGILLSVFGGILIIQCRSGSYAPIAFGTALGKAAFPRSTPQNVDGTMARFPSHPKARYCFSAELSYCMVGKWRSSINSGNGIIEAQISLATNGNQMTPARFWIIDTKSEKNPDATRILDGFITPGLSTEPGTNQRPRKESTGAQNILVLTQMSGTLKSQYSGNYEFSNPDDSGTCSLSDQ